MPELLAALLSVIGVAVVPFIGWLSQRWTREARLILRVNRLGSALQFVPSSDEKAALEKNVLAAVRDLNEWIEPINRGIRGVQLLIGVLLFVAGSWFVVWLQPLAAVPSAVSFLMSLAIGALVATAMVSTGFLMQRLFTRRRSDADFRNRVERLKRGEGLA
ncbi:hypothetical protein [Microcella sp.]|uniref:hypothetical protein n=1 Tax=Microcella sp. TaxID=1913979 RepID=UPI003F702356